MSADDQKRLAGDAAALRVQPGMVVGLGTGSTAAWFVKALAARDLSDLRCVPTSEKTADLARELGLPLAALDDVSRIDLTVDGADEVGPGLALIKGGGAALLREKLVWEASDRCIVIADSAKVVPVLGAFPLPIEVVAFGHRSTANRIIHLRREMPGHPRPGPPRRRPEADHRGRRARPVPRPRRRGHHRRGRRGADSAAVGSHPNANFAEAISSTTPSA